MVAILDADKEGFLRSETSLVQTIGRAARNAEGQVIMYADSVTPSMERAIFETERRRAIQQKYNDEHGITPQTIRKAVRELISTSLKAAEEDDKARKSRVGKDPDLMNEKELGKEIERLTKKMNQAATELNFELAAILRDEIIELKVKVRDYDK